MATDQFGRGLLVTALPGGNQRRIGRHRGDGLGLGHGAPDGGRGSRGNIKAPLNSDVPASIFEIRTSVRTPMRPYDERLEHLLARAAKGFPGKGYHPTPLRDPAAAHGL